MKNLLSEIRIRVCLVSAILPTVFLLSCSARLSGTRPGMEFQKANILIKSTMLSARTVKPGGSVIQEVTYFVGTPQKSSSINVSESVALSGNGLNMELLKNDLKKNTGSYTARHEFRIPPDIGQGDYELITIFQIKEKQSRVTTKFHVQRDLAEFAFY